MGIKGQAGDRAFNTDDSDTAEAEFRQLASQVLALLDVRDKQVAQVMEHYSDVGVADLYLGKEKAWGTKGDNTRQTITLLAQCLTENKGHAHQAHSSAGKFVAGMM